MRKQDSTPVPRMATKASSATESGASGDDLTESAAREGSVPFMVAAARCFRSLHEPLVMGSTLLFVFFFSSSSLCGLGGKGRETIIYFWVYA